MLKLFVYGTLRPEGSNAHRMSACKHLGPATATGRLYRIDWYPGLVLDSTGDTVIGDLFAAPDEQTLAALDAYEGPEYQRINATVHTANGPTEAWLWQWLGPTDESRRIASGDWRGQV